MSLSINGPGHGIPNLPGPGVDRRSGMHEEADRSRPEPRAVAPVPAEGVAVRSGSGVDPELWAMLSPDERSFYLRNAMTGPLTYGPGETRANATSPGSRLGGRIDLRA